MRRWLQALADGLGPAVATAGGRAQTLSTDLMRAFRMSARPTREAW